MVINFWKPKETNQLLFILYDDDIAFGLRNNVNSTCMTVYVLTLRMSQVS